MYPLTIPVDGVCCQERETKTLTGITDAVDNVTVFHLQVCGNLIILEAVPIVDEPEVGVLSWLTLPQRAGSAFTTMIVGENRLSSNTPLHSCFTLMWPKLTSLGKTMNPFATLPMRTTSIILPAR